jgi:hypothetical protein
MRRIRESIEGTSDEGLRNKHAVGQVEWCSLLSFLEHVTESEQR